jgi:hypothetical protein
MFFQSNPEEPRASMALGESGTQLVWRYTAITTCETELVELACVEKW